jgi:ubiquinone/menaquinone biosynthesis C-methylase UbiE
MKRMGIKGLASVGKAGPEGDWHSSQRKLWARRAAQYNNLSWATQSDFVRAFLAHCPLGPEAEVLDVGTGTGLVAKAVAPHVCKVTGIDISPEMIGQIKASGAPANIECMEGDVEKLPFTDDSFTLCTARMVFHHVENCANGLAQIRRVLRPGGHLVLCEGVPPDHLCRRRYEEIFALKEPRHTFSEAELINLLHWAGFRNIGVFPYFMEQVSLNNWLANGAVSPANTAEIRRLHLEADAHFKKVYRLKETGSDVLMDWKFVIVVGEKT